MNKEFWNNRWEKTDTKYSIDYLPPAFHCWGKFLPEDSSLSCLEIGCVPGKLLVFLNKKYGYKIKGVDYSEAITSVEENFKSNGIHEYKLYHEDFISFPLNIKADIVISLGFVEHFYNFKDVIKKHTQHLANKGILIITVPNFRFFQYYLHRIFDKESLKNHIFEAMSPNVIKDILLQNGLEIVECRYCETFSFWIDAIPNSDLKKLLRNIIMSATLKVKIFLKKFNLNDIPNKYFSPWIVCVARNSYQN